MLSFHLVSFHAETVALVLRRRTTQPNTEQIEDNTGQYRVAKISKVITSTGQ